MFPPLQILDIKMATPQLLLNYATFLEEHKFFEDSFRVYERGIDLFKHPYVGPVWERYLDRFVTRYGATKLERLRDLFEQALEGEPPSAFKKRVFLQYASVEQEFGLARHSMAVLDRACKEVAPEDRFDFYVLHVRKATEIYGATATREIFQRGIEALPDKDAKKLVLMYADMERKLGEIDRARALLAHGSQFANPAEDEG